MEREDEGRIDGKAMLAKMKAERAGGIAWLTNADLSPGIASARELTVTAVREAKRREGPRVELVFLETSLSGEPLGAILEQRRLERLLGFVGDDLRGVIGRRMLWYLEPFTDRRGTQVHKAGQPCWQRTFAIKRMPGEEDDDAGAQTPAPAPLPVAGSPRPVAHAMPQLKHVAPALRHDVRGRTIREIYGPGSDDEDVADSTPIPERDEDTFP